MPDFSVTGIVTIDNTDSLASAQEVMDATDEATKNLAILRRKALSTISMTMSMVTQTYSVLKQLVDRAGGLINPFFDMAFGMISSLISTAISGAILLTSSLHPALIAFGVTLLIISTELSIKAQLDLAESKGLMKQIVARMRTTVAETTRGIFGVGP